MCKNYTASVQEIQAGNMHSSNIAELQGQGYTKGMSEALGAYLKQLRKGRGLKVNEVLRQLGERLRLDKPVDQTRLWRVENGKGWPEGEFLIALLDIIQADLSDVAWIQEHPEAKLEDGVQRAKTILSQGSYRRATTFANQIHDVDITVAVDLPATRFLYHKNTKCDTRGRSTWIRKHNPRATRRTYPEPREIARPVVSPRRASLGVLLYIVSHPHKHH